MKVTLDLYQLKNIISDMVQVGYMNAVKCYEPTKDSISRREVARWFDRAYTANGGCGVDQG